PALPDLGHQLVLADHPVAVPDQVDDQIEDLRLERQRLRPAPQFAALGVERAVVEQVSHDFPPPAQRGEYSTVAREDMKETPSGVRSDGGVATVIWDHAGTRYERESALVDRQSGTAFGNDDCKFFRSLLECAGASIDDGPATQDGPALGCASLGAPDGRHLSGRPLHGAMVREREHDAGGLPGIPG